MSYDSFYWRYFNCGRYPAAQNQIDYYECPKWIMKEVREQVPDTISLSIGEAGKKNKELVC